MIEHDISKLEKFKQIRLSGIETFIEKSRILYGDKYDYSCVIYKRNSIKVKIRCRKHGFFMQTPANHFNFEGCSKCRYEKTPPHNKLKEVDVLSSFYDSHGEKYDYSEFSYIDVDTPSTIICRIHGRFKQSPYHHRQPTAGCPKCTKASPYTRTKYIRSCKSTGYKSNLYVIKIYNESEVFYKIGVTKMSVDSRFRSIPYLYEVEFFINGEAGYIWDLETSMHRLNYKLHYIPKIKFGGCKTECFSSIDNSVRNLLNFLSKTNQLQLVA